MFWSDSQALLQGIGVVGDDDEVFVLRGAGGGHFVVADKVRRWAAGYCTTLEEGSLSVWQISEVSRP